MTAAIIDGKAFAASLRLDIAKGVAQVKAAHGLTPGQAIRDIVYPDTAYHF